MANVFQGLPGDAGINSASFDGKVTLGGSVSLTRGDLGSRIQVKYLVSTGQIQLLKNNSPVATFNASDLSPDSDDQVALFTRGNVPLVNVPQEVFELHVPQIGGVPLTYTRFGTYAYIKANLLNINSSATDPLVAFVFGQATPGGSMPHSGSASYTSDVYGAVVVPDGTNTQYYTLGDGHGSATFGVDFTSGLVNTLISLDADGRDFGDMSGSGSITSNTAAFHGTLGGDASGEFTGAFFGPAAQEMGYVFEAAGTNGGDDFLTYGNVFGVQAPPP